MTGKLRRQMRGQIVGVPGLVHRQSGARQAYKGGQEREVAGKENLFGESVTPESVVDMFVGTRGDRRRRVVETGWFIQHR